MAAEESDIEVPKKKSLVKIVLIALIALIALGGTIGGTLFFSGFFEKKAEHPAEAMNQAPQDEGKAHGDKEAGGHGEKGAKHDIQKQSRTSPEFKRFESRYYQLEKELVSNLTGTKKVMQVQVAIMTHYDERVIEHIKKHELALRAATLDLLRQATEAALAEPDFRKRLADKVRETMNGVLEKYEDFGGIEEVYFTNFIVQ